MEGEDNSSWQEALLKHFQRSLELVQDKGWKAQLCKVCACVVYVHECLRRTHAYTHTHAHTARTLQQACTELFPLYAGDGEQMRVLQRYTGAAIASIEARQVRAVLCTCTRSKTHTHAH